MHDKRPNKPSGKNHLALGILLLLLPTIVFALWLWPRPLDVEPAPPPPQKKITFVPAPPPPPPEPPPDTPPGPQVNVHGMKKEARHCLGCHVDSEGRGELHVKNIGALCGRCHPPRHSGASHPNNIVLPATMTPKLPLAAGRRMQCHTCHDPHARRHPMLHGKKPADLCSECHRGY